MRSKATIVTTVLILFALTIPKFNVAYAQGQDGTTAERDILILAELLPGLYNNANQAYFDVRLKVQETERHERVSRQISRLQKSTLADYAFQVVDQDAEEQIYSLEVDYERNAVRMKSYSVNPDSKTESTHYLKGCDLLWRQEAGQFRALADSKKCRNHPKDMMLSKDALWFSLSDQSEGPTRDHFALDRARNFNCYADVPGVGGGRDIPYERYNVNNIHDLGGEKWFSTKEGQEIGLSLFRVMWSFNNQDGVFTRPSFVIYVKTREDNGEAKEVAYSWTETSAQRIGINLKWMLANCYMISNEDVTPFYKSDEPKL